MGHIMLKIILYAFCHWLKRYQCSQLTLCLTVDSDLTGSSCLVPCCPSVAPGCTVCFCNSRPQTGVVCRGLACLSVSESHRSLLSCPVSLSPLCFIGVGRCLAIGAQRRRSPSAVASEIFDPHLGSHILQVRHGLLYREPADENNVNVREVEGLNQNLVTF